jgi:hypothetical protein
MPRQPQPENSEFTKEMRVVVAVLGGFFAGTAGFGMFFVPGSEFYLTLLCLCLILIGGLSFVAEGLRPGSVLERSLGPLLRKLERQGGEKGEKSFTMNPSPTLQPPRPESIEAVHPQYED